MAAEMSVLLVASIKSELDFSVDSATYWTDAMCVIHYIKNPDALLMVSKHASPFSLVSLGCARRKKFLSLSWSN